MNNRLSMLLLSVTLLSMGVSHTAENKPNVIMILVDDMGWMDSSTYGSKYYQTPNMSRLAKEGMLFTDAYAASPLCSPTRASIMSGQYPARLRMTVAITRKSVSEPKALKPVQKAYCGKVESKNHMPLEIYTLAEALKDGGYTTAHIGKWHLAHKPQHYADHQGFDFVIGGAHLPGPPDYYSPYKNAIRNLKAGPKGEYLNERLAKESIKWIQSVKGKPSFSIFGTTPSMARSLPKRICCPSTKNCVTPRPTSAVLKWPPCSRAWTTASACCWTGSTSRRIKRSRTTP